MKRMHEVVPFSSYAEEKRPEREYDYMATEKEKDRIEKLRVDFGALNAPMSTVNNGELVEHYQEFSLGKTESGDQHVFRVDYGFLPKGGKNLPQGAMDIIRMKDGSVARSYLDLNPGRRMEGAMDRPQVTEIITQPGEDDLTGWHYVDDSDFAKIENIYEELKQQQAA